MVKVMSYASCSTSSNRTSCTIGLTSCGLELSLVARSSYAARTRLVITAQTIDFRALSIYHGLKLKNSTKMMQRI